MRGTGQAASSGSAVWSPEQWVRLQEDVRRSALRARTEADAWLVIARAARRVMAAYTTSFYLVSRFLPLPKRRRVEVVYAAVRYPDEIVDSFALSPEERESLLDGWRDAFERTLSRETLREMLQPGVSPFVAAFTVLSREAGIPADEYRAFLDAMRRDIRPEPFASMDELIERYVYGSAVVVGLFLARIYGPSAPDRMDGALQSARDLGIALQLTNFVRDVREDRRRGRLYIPLDILQREGVDVSRLDEPGQEERLLDAVRAVAAIADGLYRRAEAGLDAFSPDCRIAIEACIRVYGALNRRIMQSQDSLTTRQSVPFAEKWRVLPPSKYWRLPLALLER
jgi:phytoene synthase